MPIEIAGVGVSDENRWSELIYSQAIVYLQKPPGTITLLRVLLNLVMFVRGGAIAVVKMISRDGLILLLNLKLCTKFNIAKRDIVTRWYHVMVMENLIDLAQVNAEHDRSIPRGIRW